MAIEEIFFIDKKEKKEFNNKLWDIKYEILEVF